MVGMPASRITDIHACPVCPSGPVSTGWPTVLTGSMPQARITDVCVCTAGVDPIVTGAFTVLVGGMPAARIADLTGAGGALVTGYPTVLIGLG